MKEPGTYPQLARTVRAAREAANHTQTSLATAIGVSQSTIAQLERGRVRPGWDVATSLAEELGIPIALLAPEHNAVELDEASVELAIRFAMLGERDRDVVQSMVDAMLRAKAG